MDRFIKNKTKSILNGKTICPYCDKEFSTLTGVMVHLSMVCPCKDYNIEAIEATLNDREFVTCKICGKKFKRLFQHLKYAHNITSDEYKLIYGGDVICESDIENMIVVLKKELKYLWKNDSFIKLHKSNEIKNKISSSLLKFYKNNQKAKDRLSLMACERNNNISTRRFKCGYYLTKNNDKFYYQSGFELEVMKKLDTNNSVVSWIKNRDVFLQYKDFNNNNRRYIYDFLLVLINGDSLIVETKQYPDKHVLFKLWSLDKYCIENNKKWAIVHNFKSLDMSINNAIMTSNRRCDAY